MSKPVILTVDDDPVVSAAIAPDLRCRYDLLLIHELGSLSVFDGLTCDQLAELVADRGAHRAWRGSVPRR